MSKSHQWASDEPATVVGTSHALRLKNAVDHGLLNVRHRPIASWHERPARMLASSEFMDAEFATTHTAALLLVPEMRLGNRSLVNPDDPTAEIEVDKSLISEANDRALFQRAKAALRTILARNPKCRPVFWSLMGREYENLQMGRYLDGGRYHHPIWNLSDVEREFSNHVVPLQGLLPDRRTRALFVDRSMHPSWLGQQLLMRIIDTPDAHVVDLFNDLWDTAQKPVLDFDKPTVITGQSLWLRRLRAHDEAELIRLGPNISVVEPSELAQSEPESDVLFVSSLSGRTSPFVERTRKLGRFLANHAEASEHRQLKLFLWDARSAEAKRPALRADPLSSRALSRLLQPFALVEDGNDESFVQWRDVELARDNAPSIAGLLKVITLAGGRVSYEHMNSLGSTQFSWRRLAGRSLRLER